MVNVYRVKQNNEILLACNNCASKLNTSLEVIDKAADWDICEICEAQNVVDYPEFPNGEFDNGYHWNQKPVYED